jgi:hypothetical protein
VIRAVAVLKVVRQFVQDLDGLGRAADPVQEETDLFPKLGDVVVIRTVGTALVT